MRNLISTHTPLTRRDPKYLIFGKPLLLFLLTRLLRGATGCFPSSNYYYTISTHTPLTRRDSRYKSSMIGVSNFYSHASYEARRKNVLQITRISKFLLTRLLRGATGCFPSSNYYYTISTHTPLTRRDSRYKSSMIGVSNFYSHASYEARRDVWHDGGYINGFLLTRLLRGATVSSLLSTKSNKYFYSHASYEARRRSFIRISNSSIYFYSHASYEARQLHIVLVVIAPPIYKRRTQKL